MRREPDADAEPTCARRLGWCRISEETTIVTNTQGAGGPQAGWYADPAGSSQLRWWDGTQWTAYLQAAAQQPSPAQPTPVGSAAGYAGAPGYIDPAVYAPSAPVQPSLEQGASVYTPFIWIIALLPLLSAIALAAFDIDSYVRPTGSLSMLGNPMYIVVSLLGWVVYGVSVWMAYLDWRALGRLGIVRPFHWAWAFLSGIVYVVGRCVVVRKRVGGGGLLPIWVMIAVFVVTIVIVIVKIASFVSTIIQLYNY